MKYISDYKELHGDPSRSLLDHLSPEAIKDKDKVLAYLRGGENDGIRCSGVFDYVKSEPTFNTIHLYTDGEYYWDGEEIYHFEKYNMALNDAFIRKVLGA